MAVLSNVDDPDTKRLVKFWIGGVLLLVGVLVFVPISDRDTFDLILTTAWFHAGLSIGLKWKDVFLRRPWLNLFWPLLPLMFGFFPL